MTRNKNHAEQNLLRTSKENGKIVGEVLKSRCISFFAKNVCIDDILSPKCRRKVYRIEKNGDESVRVSRLLAIPVSGLSFYKEYATIHTEENLVECELNDDISNTLEKFFYI